MYNPRLSESSARAILDCIDNVGATLDKKTHTKIEHAIDLARSIGGYQIIDPDSVTEATYRAIAAGTDPIDDPAVQRALAARQLSSSLGSMTGVAQESLLHLLIDSLDAILAALKPSFNRAAETFTAAHETLTAAGVRGVDDPGLLTNRDPAVAAAHANARIALDTIGRIDAGLTKLNIALGGIIPLRGAQAIALRFDTADTPLGQLEAQNRNRQLDYWDALDRGYTIALATRTEQQHRLSHARELQNEVDTRAEAEQSAFRRGGPIARSRAQAGAR